MTKSRKIAARLKARQDGYTGLAPNPDSKNWEGSTTKPGSRNARKAS